MRDADGPPRIAGLTVLRFVAVVLITNSHLDTLYPIALLGTGGALGNALFFGLSGYGLAIGRSRFLPYGSWLMRRAARIYPSVTIVSVVLLAFFGIPEIRSVWDVLGTFLYPTRWWFLGALLAFYLPAYWLIRSGSWRAVAIAGLLAVVPYVLWYVFKLDTSIWSIEGPPSGWLKYFFYWQTMMLGIAMGLSREIRGPAGRWAATGMWSLLALYFAFKGLLYLGVSFQYQFVLHIVTLPLLYLAIWAAEDSPALERTMGTKVGMAMAFLAGITLEVYVIQSTVFSAPFVLSLAFPVNIAVFTALTLAAAALVNRAGGWVRRTAEATVATLRGRAGQGRP